MCTLTDIVNIGASVRPPKVAAPLACAMFSDAHQPSDANCGPWSGAAREASFCDTFSCKILLSNQTSGAGRQLNNPQIILKCPERLRVRDRGAGGALILRILVQPRQSAIAMATCPLAGHKGRPALRAHATITRAQRAGREARACADHSHRGSILAR